MVWSRRRLRSGRAQGDGFCSERLQEISDDGLRVAMGLVENAHVERGLLDGCNRGDARLAFQVGVGRDPWGPPRDLPIPHLGFFIVDHDVKDLRGRECEFYALARQNFDAAGG